MSQVRLFKKVTLYLIFVFFSINTNAKDYPMLHYTIEDGLASNTIYDIYQDPAGMIWIGTDKGISRFNGLKFENFTTADGLSDNECFFFQPDYEGRLWIGTYNGKLCFYKDGIFHNENNTRWLKLQKIVPHTSNIILDKNGTINIYFHKSNNYYEIFQSKIIEKTGSSSSKKVYRHRTTFANVDSLKMKKINKKIKSFEEKGLVHRLYIDSLKVMIATNSGLYIEPFDAILAKEEIHTAMKNNNEEYWVGTKKNGIFIIDTSFSKQKSINNISFDAIAFAYKKNNSLYYLTNKGDFFKINNKDSIELVFNYNSFISNLEYRFNSFSIENKHIVFGTEIGNYTIFIIKYINHYVGKKLKLNKTSLPTNLIASEELRKGITGFEKIDSQYYFKGRYYIWCHNKTFIKFSKKTYECTTIKVGREPSAIFGFSKESKNIWFSTINSVFKIIDTTPIIQPQFKNLSFREFVFSKQYLIGITHQNQLLICNNYEQKKIIIDSVNGNNCVWDKFYTLNDSTILVSTNNFFRTISFKPSKNKPIYQLRVIENPMIPYQPDFVYADSNEIYFFKKNEIKSFPTCYVLKENPLPTIQFSYLKTTQEKFFIKDTLVLDYGQSKDLKVLFTPISYYHQKLSYEYSISEKNDKATWSSFEGEELNLIKIGYGKFTIKVRVKTLSGDYSSPAKFILIVNKPFWATWWFIGFCLVVLIATAATIARIGIKLKLKKKEGEVRFLRSEYKAMNALMNPHFVFNSLNSVQSLVNNNENNTASRYIRIFSDLIRQNMRNIAQELIPISKELDLVENYLKIEKLRFKDKLNFSINIDEDVETELIFVPPLLIQPLVENAIKHGIWPKKTSDGFIEINLFEKQNILHIEISDNGNGINSNAQSDTMHESYAMSNIYTRIEQLSKIHQTKIECHIAEIKNENGLVMGVKSEITIHLTK